MVCHPGKAGKCAFAVIRDSMVNQPSVVACITQGQTISMPPFT